MLLYRLTHAKFAGDLSGLGAKKYGGRWNPKGIPIVYCCENISLCALETAAHSDGISELKNLYITCFELSSKTKIKHLQASQLPLDARSDGTIFGRLFIQLWLDFLKTRTLTNYFGSYSGN